ncbi:N-(5'-phosphoribosyl)anthranilate isomerase [Planctomycetes bacterium MalM25]|nr:N-(5'-phosphoribosyl)anthranilate isomerase [Planctomycetes bacterium MalM25]
MFRIKICGVTQVDDALVVADAGADAIGLNFYKKSPRSISAETAATIVEALKERLLTVGVFVNHSPAEIATIVDRTGLGAVQLHGDEPDEMVADLPAGLPIIRAIRMGPEGLGPVAKRLAAAQKAGSEYAALLVDAAVKPAPGQATEYGGTGHTVDWAGVRSGRELLGSTPLILAGGLKPGNVAEALQATGADGVDTASGVETSPGVKDPDQVRRFVENARKGLDSGR